MKLLATYPSERAARRAVRALQAAGIDPSEIRVDEPKDDRDELKAEQHDEVSFREIAPGVPGTGAGRRAVVGGSIIGIPIGAVIGLAIGFAGAVAKICARTRATPATMPTVDTPNTPLCLTSLVMSCPMVSMMSTSRRCFAAA